MAVLIEGISVLVRVSTISAKLPGGIDAFRQLVRNSTYCADGDLARVGFMTPTDTERFVKQLLQLGFVHLSNEGVADIVVVDQLQGPLSACSWVEFGHAFLDGKSGRIAICRSPGGTDKTIALPDGWSFENSLSASHTFVPTEKTEESVEYKGRQKGLDVYADRKSGKELFAGRVAASSEDVKHDEYYKRAIEQLKFAMTLVPPIRLSLLQKWRIRRGLGAMRKALAIRPDNWAALWTMGKALQVTGKNAEAMDVFSRSHSINPQHPDIAREASISAMECSRFDRARSFAEAAVQLRPEDPGLMANLVLVLLLAQDARAAKSQIERAFAADPKDRITRAIRQIVDEVIAGSRPCPRHTRELHG
jgi:hypothetical protein